MTKTTAQRIIDEFVRRGIDAKRIIPMNRVPQEGWLAAYRSIDILLDTTPWSGHTTACEALWMGVPVVTLTGERHAGRMVTSILHAVGKPGWCASSADDFVRIAHDCAYNLFR